MKDENMNPDARGRRMLLVIPKYLDYKDIEEPNGFEEMQLNQLLLDKVTWLSH